MTIGKIEELFQKFEPLFFQRLENPTDYICSCGAEEEGARHRCSCGSTMPQEVDAFDSALHWLQFELGEEKLSQQELVQFVNLRARDVLREHTISYELSKNGNYFVSYQPRALELPFPVQDTPNEGDLARKTRQPLGIRLLELLLPKKEREAALGDLEEEFTDLRERKGLLAANHYLYKQFVRSLWPLVRRGVVRVIYKVFIRSLYVLATAAIRWMIEHFMGLSSR